MYVCKILVTEGLARVYSESWEEEEEEGGLAITKPAGRSR